MRTQGAIAGGLSPYMAGVIHDMTTRTVQTPNGPKDEINVTANLMAHAVLGAVVAQVNGNSALAGASGAVAGEYIAQQLYPGKDRSKLTEQEKQSISTLATLASGLAGGITGNSTANALAGAQAGKNAVENNALSAIVQGGRLAVQGCAEVAACRNALVEKGLGALLGIGIAKTALDNISSTERDYVFNVAMSGKADLIEKLTPEQRAAYDYMVGQDQKGLITIFPQPDRDLTGGKLVTPAHDQSKGTTLETPDQRDQNGASHTGNTISAPDTGGNSTVTPLPEHNKDDLAYLDKITQGEHASIRNKEGRPVGSVINDVQKSRPADILMQDDGRWIVKGSGGKVHIIESDGEVVTSFYNPKANTDARVRKGEWNNPSNKELEQFKQKFSDYIKW